MAPPVKKSKVYYVDTIKLGDCVRDKKATEANGAPTRVCRFDTFSKQKYYPKSMEVVGTSIKDAEIYFNHVSGKKELDRKCFVAANNLSKIRIIKPTDADYSFNCSLAIFNEEAIAKLPKDKIKNLISASVSETEKGGRRNFSDMTLEEIQKEKPKFFELLVTLEKFFGIPKEALLLIMDHESNGVLYAQGLAGMHGLFQFVEKTYQTNTIHDPLFVHLYNEFFPGEKIPELAFKKKEIEKLKKENPEEYQKIAERYLLTNLLAANIKALHLAQNLKYVPTRSIPFIVAVDASWASFKEGPIREEVNYIRSGAPLLTEVQPPLRNPLPPKRIKRIKTLLKWMPELKGTLSIVQQIALTSPKEKSVAK